LLPPAVTERSAPGLLPVLAEILLMAAAGRSEHCQAKAAVQPSEPPAQVRPLLLGVAEPWGVAPPRRVLSR